MTRLEEVKKRKVFAPLDLVLYGAIALVVIALFCVFVFFRGEAEGISVEREGQILYTYDFAKGGTVQPAGEGYVSVTEGEGVVTVRVTTEDGAGYNVISIDVAQKTVRVTEANCSRTPDCVYTAEIKDASGGIICVPHRLKIVPVSGESFTPSTG